MGRDNEVAVPPAPAGQRCLGLGFVIVTAARGEALARSQTRALFELLELTFGLCAKTSTEKKHQRESECFLVCSIMK